MDLSTQTKDQIRACFDAAERHDVPIEFRYFPRRLRRLAMACRTIGKDWYQGGAFSLSQSCVATGLKCRNVEAAESLKDLLDGGVLERQKERSNNLAFVYKYIGP